MKKEQLNWSKIIAVGGLAFCTTLVASGFNTHTAVANAILTGLIALFTEMKIESEGKLGKIKAVQGALKHGLVV